MSQAMVDAVSNGEVATIRALIDEGEDPNGVIHASGWSLLMLAAELQQIDSIEQLLERGADPNYSLESGWTALHHAVDSECDAEAQSGVTADGRSVALLVAAGSDPDAVFTDRGGRTHTPRTMAHLHEIVGRALG